jgi:hypothetical protein
MISSSFTRFGQSGGDDPQPRATLRIGDGEEVVFDHVEQEIAILAVVMTSILARHRKGVVECRRAVSKLTP